MKISVKVKLDENALLPTKAHKEDAGFDLYSPMECEVKAGESVIVDTGVHMVIPKGYVGFLKSKSGLNVKHGIISEGVIDAGYTGSIVTKLYNRGTETHTFAKGSKLTQIVILPIPGVELETVDTLEETERGTNGFGSSGV